MPTETRLVMEHRRRNISMVKELPGGAIEAPGSREMHRIFHSADGQWKFVEKIGYWLRSPQKVDVDALMEQRRREIRRERDARKAERKAAQKKTTGKAAKGGNGRRKRKKALIAEQQDEAARQHTIRLLRTSGILTKFGEVSPEVVAEKYGHRDTPTNALERLRELVDLGEAVEIRTDRGPVFRAIRGGQLPKQEEGTFRRTFGGPVKDRGHKDTREK